jgi:methyl-accepting chemotaxis protein
MSLTEDYPKTKRNYTALLQRLLSQDQELDEKLRREIALALNDMSDLACDLEDIRRRLVDETHSSAEIGELLIAFELTTEQLRGMSEIIDGKLYEIGDRLRGVQYADEIE